MSVSASVHLQNAPIQFTASKDQNVLERPLDCPVTFLPNLGLGATEGIYSRSPGWVDETEARLPLQRCDCSLAAVSLCIRFSCFYFYISHLITPRYGRLRRLTNSRMI